MEGSTQRDVSELMKRASESLKVGEMIHSADFDLAKIMNAVEIGDPRLDAGARGADIATSSSQNEELVNDLNLKSQADIGYNLMIREATWYNGSNLAQTIYTCRYLPEQERIKHLPILNALVLSAKLLARLLSDIINDAGVCAEEDILAYHFDYHFIDSPIQKPLQNGLNVLRQAVSDCSNLDDEDKAIGSKLAHHLQFRQLLLEGFSAIIQNTKQDIDVGKKSLIQALNKLQHIDFPQKSHEESSLGFSPSMNDDRMGPVPPKKVTLLSGQEACKKFKKVIEETIELCNIVKVRTWPELNAFLDEIAQKRFDPIPRSILSILLISVTQIAGAQSWQPQMAMARSVLGFPKPANAEFGHEISRFMSHFQKMIQELAQNKCMNRARQRRRHRRCGDQWADLSVQAVFAESSPGYTKWLQESGWQWTFKPESKFSKQGPLQTWVEKECCRTMLNHFLLGFELECYLPYDYCMIFWYCEYLLGIVIESCDVLALRFPAVSDKSARRKNLPKLSPLFAKSAPQALDLLAEGRIGFMERHLCRAYLRTALALQSLGVLKSRPSPFNTEEQVYEQRFFFFSVLSSPPYVGYEDYALATRGSGVNPLELLRTASINFQDARLSAASILKEAASIMNTFQVSEAEAVDKIAKQNSVATQILASDIEKQYKKLLEAQSAGNSEVSEKVVISLQWNVTWEFLQHPSFPTLKLTKA